MNTRRRKLISIHCFIVKQKAFFISGQKDRASETKQELFPFFFLLLSSKEINKEILLLELLLKSFFFRFRCKFSFKFSKTKLFFFSLRFPMKKGKVPTKGISLVNESTFYSVWGKLQSFAFFSSFTFEIFLYFSFTNTHSRSHENFILASKNLKKFRELSAMGFSAVFAAR